MVNVTLGVNQRLYGDKALTDMGENTRYQIQPHLDNLKAKHSSFDSLNAGLFTIGDFEMLVMNAGRVGLPPVEPELLYVLERTNQHPKDVLEATKPKVLILSANLDWKTRNYWRHVGSDYDLSIHDIALDGAFTIDLTGKV